MTHYQKWYNNCSLNFCQSIRTSPLDCIYEQSFRYTELSEIPFTEDKSMPKPAKTTIKKLNLDVSKLRNI